MNRMSTARRTQAIQALVDGMSLSAIQRVLGISYNGINKLLIDAGSACAAFHDRRVRNVVAGHVEVDEVWSFIHCKQRALNEGTAVAPPPYAGHAWAWTAFDSDSKFMISWLTAPRDFNGALALITDLESRVDSIELLSSDGLYAYESAVEDVFNGGIDFGQYVKPNTTASPHADTPLDIPKPRRVAVFGRPAIEEVNTSFVERANLTLRMGNRRFTRKTNAFSKKLENHKHSLALFYTHYNWCRPHLSLGGATPAMAAGLAKSRYPVEWIVELVDMCAKKPNRPKRYRKRRAA